MCLHGACNVLEKVKTLLKKIEIGKLFRDKFFKQFETGIKILNSHNHSSDISFL